MDKSTEVPSADQALPLIDAGSEMRDTAGIATSAATNVASSASGADPAGAVELLFKVANATAASLIYEASCGNSPLATAEKSSEQPLPEKAAQAALETSPTPHTPQKPRANPDVTPSTWTGTTQQRELGDDDSEFEGLAPCTLAGGEDDDDDFLAATPSPNGNGRRLQGSPLAPSTSARRNGQQRRQGWSRYDEQDGGGKSAARKAAPRYGGGPSMNERHPPLPPPSGSLRALPADHVQKFLRLVQDGDYTEALKALRKVRRAVKGRGCSKEAFGGMRALMHHLLEGYASSGRLSEALEVLENMKNSTEARLVSAAAFNAVLRGLLARGAMEEARFVVREEMSRLAVTPNEGSLNLLMDTAARAGPTYLEEAWDVLEEMQHRGLRADKYTVSILTKGISERGDKRRAPRGVLLVEHFLKTQPEDVDEVLVNSLLDVFCRMGDMPRLEATLGKMREYGIRGSAVTYGTIVKAYGKAGNIEKVLQAWAEMGRLGLEANAVTYGCMLDACVKCGHLEKALQVFAIMKDQGLHRNTILYATLIKGFAKGKDPTAARKLHHEMVSEGVQCNVVVYNSLIDACVRANDLHGAAEVLQQMRAAGVKPDLITFSTLIKGYCSSGELSKAMRLADELRARNLECDEIVYNSLLEGCVKAGDLQLGLRLFTEMKQHQVRPSSVTFSILVKLLSRAGRLDLACHLVSREMREMHAVTPTRMVWSCLVTCCVKARDLARAVMVLDLLDREGGATGSARTSMYATVIEGCLTQGEVSLSLGLCERAYSRVPPEEGMRGILSADLLRRVFEAVGARGPEAEARQLLDVIGSRLSDQVRSSLEEALSRGCRRRSPRAGGASRDARGAGTRANVGEASSMAALGGDSLLNSSSASMAWNGGVVAAAQQWPSYTPGGSPGMEALSNRPAEEAHSSMLNSAAAQLWDPSGSALGNGAANPWAWQSGMQGMQGLQGLMPGADGYGGYGFDPYNPYNPYNNWGQWNNAWDDGAGSWAAAAIAAAAATGTSPLPADLGLGAANWPAAAAAAASAGTAPMPADLDLGAANWSMPATAAAAATTAPSPIASDLGLGAAVGTAKPPEDRRLEALVADTPKPDLRGSRGLETPSTASGGPATERTPATTAGRSSNLRSPAEEEDDADENASPVNMRLFAPGSASDTTTNGGKGTPMRVDVTLSALLDGPVMPPGLH